MLQDPPMPAKPTTPEADLAFLRAIVDAGDGRGFLTLGVAYLAGGLLYGLQCLFHLGQAAGWIRWPDAANLAFVIGVSLSFLLILSWAVWKDRSQAGKGPTATRALNAAFSGAGLANLAGVIIFGVGAARDQDFALWLYYPAVMFVLQAAAWHLAWVLKRKPWMLAAAIGGWAAAVALGLTVRDPGLYLLICTAALFILFAGPGWIMVRDAVRARQAVG